MAKTNKPKRKMGRYFKMVQRNAYILSYNKKGSCSTNIKKWDIIKKLTKKIIADDERAGRLSKRGPHSLDTGVKLLPRQDVTLYGTIPKMEHRVYSKCKDCNRVFNPRDILSHRNCSKSTHSTHTNILKEKIRGKSGMSKKSSNTVSSDSNVSTNNTVITPPAKFVERVLPSTGGPSLTTASSPLPQLKVSVTKIGLPKTSKSTTVSASSTSSTLTTSSDKSDTRVSSSKISSSVHNTTRGIPSIHQSSKVSPSVHNHQKSVHPSPRSPSSNSSYNSPKSPSNHHSLRSPSRTHHGSGRNSNTNTHISSKPLSKPTSTDMVPSSTHHHHSSSSSSYSSNSPSNHKHKKSSATSSPRKSSNSTNTVTTVSSNKILLAKDYDPDMHCGVVDGNKGPCMRSITCSNHRIQLRKLVPGRRKDIHQLIAERKAAKKKDLKHSSNVSCSYTSPNGEAKDTPNNNHTTYVPIVAKIANTTIEPSVSSSYVPILPRASTQIATSLLSTTKANVMESDKKSSVALTNGYIPHAKNIETTQDNIGTVPVLIMPVSPISVVSSVQFLKIANNIISLESPQSATNPPLTKQSVILPIQTTNTNGVKMYESHPKPVVLPNFGARRVGGAILVANRCLDAQRSELLTALNKRRETVNNNRGISILNHINNIHRPNILKVKTGTKVNCKRPANDKLVTSDSKRLVPDVNGFILHADVSETADAPHSNNCIQEKFAILNMK